MIYVLLGIVFIFFLLCLIKYEYDLLAAPCVMMLISIVCLIAYIYISKIYEVNMEGKLFSIILTGMFAVFLGALIPKSKNVSIVNNYNIKYIDISVYKRYLMLIFAMCVTIITIKECMSVTGMTGKINLDTLLGVSSAYRRFYIKTETLLPNYVRLLLKMHRMLAYILICILANNIVVKKIGMKEVQYLATIIFSCISSVFQGARTDIIQYTLAFLTLWLIMYEKRNGNVLNHYKIIIFSLFAIILILYFFSQIRFFVGRTNPWSAFEYIAYYFGIPLCAFQKHLEVGNGVQFQMNALETFECLYENLNIYFPGIFGIPKGNSFIYYNGKSLGNIYTAFKKFYNDFGYFGVFFFSFIESYIFSKFYIAIKGKNIKFYLYALYAYLIPCFYLMMYDEHFYSIKIRVGTIVDFVLLYLWIFVLFKLKLCFGHRRENALKI